MQTRELTEKARGIARCLTYNDDEHQAAAKHILLEMSHRLDALDIRISKKKDGLYISNGIGKSRFATLKETILYKFFGVLPKQI